MKRIYISGKISGIEIEAVEIFEKAERHLKDANFDVVNPMKLNQDHNKTWHDYMREDVKALCDCDSIYMLENWKDSKGAIIEHTIAMYLGLDVYYEFSYSTELTNATKLH